ncbi:hypothetical protein CEF21_21200 [Bacillus sp. FJAT-42376]|uniref:hypothetical protein n=1 Tax=Bacillus sp. FJAT-42376 TaxID=2014076 RepID=UPI000F4D6F2A|nr:hypothetical protein [Bacillus sp. FJAT-42376]AZB44599.1 hypothetical protein CEF21_21200 [Bacillus sp. FJAT-42376]
MKRLWISTIIMTLVLGVLLQAEASSAPVFQKIGPQISNLNATGAAAALNKKGEPLMYTLLQGLPAKLVVTNLATGNVIDTESLEGSTAAWSIEASQNEVWIGTTPGELLFRYDPNAMKLTKAGKATAKNGTTIWGLSYSAKERVLYGVSANEGKLFSYTAGKGFKDLGTVAAGKKDGKSVEADDANRQLFIGTGSPAQLVSYDLRSGKKQNMLPAKYQSQKQIDAINVAGGSVFVKLNPENKLLIFDAKSKKLTGELAATSKGVSPKSPSENAVYYANGTSLYRYDLGTKKTALVVHNRIPTSIVSLDFVPYPGAKEAILTGKVGNADRYFTYRPSDKSYENLNLNLPAQPVEVHKIGAGADGKIYSSGFLNGKMGTYQVSSGKSAVQDAIGQMESMTSLNGKLYFGVYPGAKIMEYNPSSPWAAGQNPKEVSAFGHKGQDRPIAASAIPGTSKLVFGTAPRAGINGGALAIYDASSRSSAVRHQIVKDQSVISLAYHAKSKKIYAGTSIFGKSNVDKNRTNAVLFALPAGNVMAKPEVIRLPFKHVQFISALTALKDGRIIGLADGNVFVFVPGKGVTVQRPIVKSVSGYSQNTSLALGKDGHVYGTVEKVLFKLDLKTYQASILRKGTDQVAADSAGTLFFHDKRDLWKMNQ